jgi:CBS domain-containing protein
MLWEESRATIPFVAILSKILAKWSVAMRMTVADLMCEKPVTLGPNKTADAALEALYEYEASELYIVDKAGKFLGILPDYEVLKTQLSGESSLLRVDQLMSRNVPFVSPTADAAEVARKFRESHCSRLAVVKSGRLVGVVTRADVLRLMVVLRRVDSSESKPVTSTKPPKFLSTPDRSPTRSGRARTLTPKATSSRSRTKSSSRRATAPHAR